MQSRVCRVLLASLALAGCAAAGAEESLDGPEARSQAEMILELRLSHLEERLSAVETAVGTLRGSPETPRSAPGGLPPSPAGTPGVSPDRAPGGGRRVVPETPAAPLRKEGAPRTPAGGGEQAAYDAALNFYERRQWDAALESFQNFLRQYPGGSLAPNALYWLGETHYAAGRTDLAIMEFKKVAEAYPRHAKTAAALLKAGYAYARLGDRENARFYWQILLDDFPDSAPAALARKRLAGP
jgi:tol-pal system protein YbgF